MSQLNTTPDTSTYVLGRGKMYFASLHTDGTPLGYRFVGNCESITATVDSENYEHFRTTSSIKTKDLDILLQQSISWTATLENMDKENLAIFFSATDVDGFANPAITGFAGVTLVPDGTLVSAATGGLWYTVVDANGDTATGLTATNDLTLSSTNATPVELTLNTDYTVDSTTGRVYFLDSAAVQTIITNEEGVTATVTADASAPASSKLQATAAGETNVAVMFELINTSSGENELIYYVHKAGVTPNGDLNLLSDEVAQLPITIAVEQNDAYDYPMTIRDLRE